MRIVQTGISAAVQLQLERRWFQHVSPTRALLLLHLGLFLSPPFQPSLGLLSLLLVRWQAPFLWIDQLDERGLSSTSATPHFESITLKGSSSSSSVSSAEGLGAAGSRTTWNKMVSSKLTRLQCTPLLHIRPPLDTWPLFAVHEPLKRQCASTFR